jgi:hypothetical protein
MVIQDKDFVRTINSETKRSNDLLFLTAKDMNSIDSSHTVLIKEWFREYA